MVSAPMSHLVGFPSSLEKLALSMGEHILEVAAIQTARLHPDVDGPLSA